MNTEQKAKDYDRALNEAVAAYKDEDKHLKATLERIFPVLKESEDGKIKRILHSISSKMCFHLHDIFTDEEFQCFDAWSHAWLEKQRTSEEALQYLKENHSPSEMSDFQAAMNIAVAKAYDKEMKDGLEKQSEQKFHQGDWVVYNNDICQIVKREEGCNKLVTVFGIEKELVNERNLSTARLWTIQDAKDGDVFVTDIWTFIFKKYQDKSVYYHCAASTFNDFSISDTGEFDSNYVHPATKEQRDTLFAKMKEAGYEWDAVKKKLKKVKQKPVEWGEEDKEIVEALNDYVKNLDIFFTKITIGDKDIISKEFRKKVQQWLNSIKERVQSKQEWREEHEKDLLEKFRQAVYDCSWRKVTCKAEGETKEEYANRWAEQFLLIVKNWMDDFDYTIQQKLRKSCDNEKENAIKGNSHVWNKDDEKIRKAIIDFFSEPGRKEYILNEFTVDDIIDWLKSLKSGVQSKIRME